MPTIAVFKRTCWVLSEIGSEDSLTRRKLRFFVGF